MAKHPAATLSEYFSSLVLHPKRGRLTLFYLRSYAKVPFDREDFWQSFIDTTAARFLFAYQPPNFIAKLVTPYNHTVLHSVPFPRTLVYHLPAKRDSDVQKTRGEFVMA